MKDNQLVRFVRGDTIMAQDIKDYYLFDKSEEYFSMIPFNPENCIDGETIVEVNWGNGYQSAKIVLFIPDRIDGYRKIVYPPKSEAINIEDNEEDAPIKVSANYILSRKEESIFSVKMDGNIIIEADYVVSLTGLKFWSRVKLWWSVTKFILKKGNEKNRNCDYKF